jgi:hypothetical protein
VSHELRGDREELAAVVPRHAPLGGQPYPRFVTSAVG